MSSQLFESSVELGNADNDDRTNTYVYLYRISAPLLYYVRWKIPLQGRVGNYFQLEVGVSFSHWQPCI